MGCAAAISGRVHPVSGEPVESNFGVAVVPDATTQEKPVAGHVPCTSSKLLEQNPWLDSSETRCSSAAVPARDEAVPDDEHDAEDPITAIASMESEVALHTSASQRPSEGLTHAEEQLTTHEAQKQRPGSPSSEVLAHATFSLLLACYSQSNLADN